MLGWFFFFLSWPWMSLMIKFLYNWVGHPLKSFFLRGPFGCLIGSFFFLSWPWLPLMILTPSFFWQSWHCLSFSSFLRVLGKSLVVDVVLWMNWRGAVAMLVYVTTLWYLFERVDCNFLSFVTKVFANKLWCLLWTLGSRRSWSKISRNFLFWSMYFRHVSLYFMFSSFFSFLFSFFFNVDVLYSPSYKCFQHIPACGGILDIKLI